MGRFRQHVSNNSGKYIIGIILFFIVGIGIFLLAAFIAGIWPFAKPDETTTTAKTSLNGSGSSGSTISGSSSSDSSTVGNTNVATGVTMAGETTVTANSTPTGTGTFKDPLSVDPSTMVFNSWRIWTDPATFNFVNNINGKVFRIWGAEAKTSAEHWCKDNGKGQCLGDGVKTGFPDYYHFENWSFGMTGTQFVMENRSDQSQFVLDTSDAGAVNVKTSSIAPKTESKKPNAGLGWQVRLGEWDLQTDKFELRIIHRTTGNCCYINKNGMSFNKNMVTEGYGSLSADGKLKFGDVLIKGQFIQNNKFRLLFQLDSNLTLSRVKDDGTLETPVWAAGTNGKNGGFVALQDNGKPIMYSLGGKEVLWQADIDKDLGKDAKYILVKGDRQIVSGDSKGQEANWKL